MISNGLGSFANLGAGYGLRLGGLDIQEQEISNLNEDTPGLVAFFISPSGEQVAYLQTGRGQGAKLESELSFRKYGNLDNFSIEIARANKLPIFTGMDVQFIYKNKKFAFGYVEDVPASDQNGGTVRITGSGYAKKLKDKKITLSVTNDTVNEIIETIGTTYFSDLGINYSATKNQAPSTNIASANWKNKSIEKIIEDLISVSNEDFETVEYIYGIDSVGSFYFNGIESNSPKKAFGEGFKYQKAKTEENSQNIVNRVEVYRATSADPKTTEFVATYEDSDSIDNNGIYERKLTISDFVDTTTAQKIAEGIIQDNKNPKTRVSIEDLLIEEFLDFDFYVLNNKLQEQKNIISEFVALTDWDQTLTTSTIALRSTTVFSGRQCYQWDIDNSVGDFIQKDIGYFQPQFLRLYLRQDTAGEYLQITINGIIGNILTNMVTNVPKNFVTNVPKNIKVVTLQTTPTGIQTIGVPTANEWIAVNIDLTGFFKVDSVKIEITETDAVEILIDRMEIYTESYVRRNLSLQEITYKFGSSSVKAIDATFGQDKITLTEKLNKIDKKNTIAYDIFSKQ